MHIFIFSHYPLELMNKNFIIFDTIIGITLINDLIKLEPIMDYYYMKYNLKYLFLCLQSYEKIQI